MHRHSTLALGALALLVCACTIRDSATNDSAVADTTRAAPNVVTITATDYAFDAPAEIPAGATTFRLINKGEALHHATLVRLEEGKTAADLEAAFKNPGPPPRWAVPVGGPNAIGTADSANATTVLAPGNYALVCFVDLPGGVPHFAKGMVRPLTVSASSGSNTAPTADVTMTLKDYGFDLSRPLVAGTQTIAVEVAPMTQPHEVEVVKLLPGKTLADVQSWLKSMEGPPPAIAVGGVAGTIPGTKNSFEVTLDKGDYALICFLPDAKDGKPHHAHGMIQGFSI